MLMIFVNDILDNLRLSGGSNYDTLDETPTQPGFVLAEDNKLILKYYPKKEYSTNLLPLKRIKTKFTTQKFYVKD